jgi:hypothetical protein
VSQSPHDPSPEPSAAAQPAAEALSAAPTPRILAAAAIAGLEGLAVAAWGVTMFFTDSDNAVLAGLTVLVLAAVPLAAAYGLTKLRRWSRGPALVMQLLALPVAWTMLHSSGAVVGGGAFLGVLALAGLALLVHPTTTDALGARRTTT